MKGIVALFAVFAVASWSDIIPLLQNVKHYTLVSNCNLWLSVLPLRRTHSVSLMLMEMAMLTKLNSPASTQASMQVRYFSRSTTHLVKSVGYSTNIYLNSLIAWILPVQMEMVSWQLQSSFPSTWEPQRQLTLPEPCSSTSALTEMSLAQLQQLKLTLSSIHSTQTVGVYLKLILSALNGVCRRRMD